MNGRKNAGSLENGMCLPVVKRFLSLSREVCMSEEILSVLHRLETVPLIGRSAECAFLSRHLDTALHSGSIVALSGEPGIGKTKVATAVAETFRATGTQLLSLRCYEQTQTLPYAPFIDLKADLPALSGL